MSNLTIRERDILRVVRSHIDANGVSPSYREISEALNLHSLSSIHKIVRRLADKGVITATHRGRSIAFRDDEVPVIKRWLEARVRELRRAPRSSTTSHERAEMLDDELDAL
jgi:SOS-response transcriptional repressor LexA